MSSIWSETQGFKAHPPLYGDAKTDTLIIGGGMAGVLCAYCLHKADAPYILLEGNYIGSGITKNTTAKITAQHGLIYHKLLESVGAEKTEMYLDANIQALEIFRELCKNIDCDFEDKDAFVYSLSNRSAIEQEIQALHKVRFPARFADKTPLPFYIAGAVCFPKQAQFHPLKFLAAISEGLNIYEQTFVKKLEPNTAITDQGRITAKNIIVATHFPFLNRRGLYFMKMIQHRSYVISLTNAPDVEGMYIEDNENGLSFRNYKDFLFIGGGDHQTGHKGGNWQVLRDMAAHTYPHTHEQYAWATQDCMTLDGIPYIGRYSKSLPNCYVATGFNKWGMTSSMVAATILTDMILGRKNEIAKIFSPQRSMLKPRLLANALSTTGNLLTPFGRRCPHMGCVLKWNHEEHSWDCPCHGSRFERTGALIDNPAMRGLKP